MDRTPLFAVEGKTITAEDIARLFVKLAGRPPTAEETDRVRSRLAESERAS